MNKILMSVRTAVAAIPALVALTACAGVASTPTTPAAATATSGWADAGQMILVITPDWDATQGTLRRFERDGAQWRAVGDAFPVTVGRTGIAWGLGLHPAQSGGPVKHEGDGRAPAGVFRIGTAFGYAPTARTALSYAPMGATDWCVDVDGSPYYNRIVDSREVGDAAVAGSTEPMRRDLHADGDQRYRMGFVIEQNPDARAGGGSCIFGHLWKAPGEATSGCTAMDPASMEALYGWLDRARHPVLVQLTRDEARRLAVAWRLPALDDRAR